MNTWSHSKRSHPVRSLLKKLTSPRLINLVSKDRATQTNGHKERDELAVIGAESVKVLAGRPREDMGMHEMAWEHEMEQM